MGSAHRSKTYTSLWKETNANMNQRWQQKYLCYFDVNRSLSRLLNAGHLAPSWAQHNGCVDLSRWITTQSPAPQTFFQLRLSTKLCIYSHILVYAYETIHRKAQTKLNISWNLQPFASILRSELSIKVLSETLCGDVSKAFQRIKTPSPVDCHGILGLRASAGAVHLCCSRLLGPPVCVSYTPTAPLKVVEIFSWKTLKTGSKWAPTDVQAIGFRLKSSSSVQAHFAVLKQHRAEVLVLPCFWWCW